MAKRSRKRGRSTAAVAPMHWGGVQAKAKDRRTNLVIAAVVVLAVIAAAGYAAWQLSARWAFDTLAASGAPALAQVETLPDAGRDHLEPGQSYAYADRFPTSGPHDPAWTAPGVYESEQPPTRLVHALEHGNIVIYYDDPGEEALAQLRAWAARYSGQWDGLVVTPAPGLGRELVLTAWTKRLHLDQFEAEAAAAFIDAFRGRGPEHPVR